MRPGNPKVVHHGRVIVLPPGATWMKNAKPGESYEEGSSQSGGAGDVSDLVGKYNLGLGAFALMSNGHCPFFGRA